MTNRCQITGQIFYMWTSRLSDGGEGGEGGAGGAGEAAPASKGVVLLPAGQ